MPVPTSTTSLSPWRGGELVNAARRFCLCIEVCISQKRKWAKNGQTGNKLLQDIDFELINIFIGSGKMRYLVRFS